MYRLAALLLLALGTRGRQEKPPDLMLFQPKQSEMKAVEPHIQDMNQWGRNNIFVPTYPYLALII
jgi:hypothetical protein